MDSNVWGAERDNSRHITVVRTIILKEAMVGRLQLFKEEITKFLGHSNVCDRNA